MYIFPSDIGDKGKECLKILIIFIARELSFNTCLFFLFSLLLAYNSCTGEYTDICAYNVS
jgi:hypothetical protein